MFVEHFALASGANALLRSSSPAAMYSGARAHTHDDLMGNRKMYETSPPRLNIIVKLTVMKAPAKSVSTYVNRHAVLPVISPRQPSAEINKLQNKRRSPPTTKEEDKRWTV